MKNERRVGCGPDEQLFAQRQPNEGSGTSAWVRKARHRSGSERGPVSIWMTQIAKHYSKINVSDTEQAGRKPNRDPLVVEPGLETCYQSGGAKQPEPGGPKSATTTTTRHSWRSGDVVAQWRNGDFVGRAVSMLWRSGAVVRCGDVVHVRTSYSVPVGTTQTNYKTPRQPCAPRRASFDPRLLGNGGEVL